MSKFDSNDLERRTAARLSSAGFVPVLNVIHRGSNSEFDIYAYHPHPDSVHRLMVQCTTSSPGNEKMAALKGNAISFDCQHWMFVTRRKPHPTKLSLAEAHGTVLLEERGDICSGTVDDCLIDLAPPPTDREMLITSAMMGFAYLRQEARSPSLPPRTDRARDAVSRVDELWKRLEEVPLTTDPFRRLEALYGIYESAPEISADCAEAEDLADDRYKALFEAFAKGRGSVTQCALALQTLNRLQTIVALCECACLVSDADIPSDFQFGGKISNLIRSLRSEKYRHLLARFAFELLYAWGGMWLDEHADVFWNRIANDVGVKVAEAQRIKEFLNRLFQSIGVSFIRPVESGGVTWHNLYLLPYFIKGVGIRRMERELSCTFDRSPCSQWRNCSVAYEGKCRAWEEKHH
ncbi:hypothetical protein LLH23_07835 [bacterium]|nr:hypothetical protein [bacterium]